MKRYARILIIILALMLVGGIVYLVFSRATAPEEAQAISLTTQDGVSLAATYYPGSAERGVILAHGYGETRAIAAPLAEQLQNDGFSVVALDLHGHGESSGDYTTFTAADWEKLPLDIAAAHAFLLTISSTMQIGVVGGEIGANAVIAHAASIGGVTAVVTLSPNPNYRGLASEDAFTQYAGALYVMDQYIDPDDEKYHGEGIEPIVREPAGDLFFAATTADKEWYEVKEGGRGWALVKEGSEVEKRIREFLDAKL
jgi:pimeloyl-ACP methyl ester carboxylesterase